MVFCVLRDSDTPAAAICFRANFSSLAGIAAVVIAFCCCATAADNATQQKYDRFLKLLQENPGPGSTLNFVVRHHTENQTIEPFAASLYESAERNPEDGKGWLLVGLLELERGRADDAVTALRRAAQLMPNAPTAQHSLAISLIHSGQLKEAVPPLERALELYQNTRDVERCVSTLSKIHRRLQQPTPALEVWNRALTRFPRDTRILNEFLQSMSEQGDYEAALEALLLNRGRLSDPQQQLHAQIRIAEFRARSGRISEALNDLLQLQQNLLPDTPSFQEVRDCIRDIIRNTDYSDRKIDFLISNETLTQADAEIAETLIEKLKDAGRDVEAEQWIARSVRNFPDSWRIRQLAVQDLALAHNYGAAARECEEFCAIAPQNEEAIETWGRILLQRTDLSPEASRSLAAQVWERLWELTNPQTDHRTKVISLLQETRQYERALEFCRKAVQSEPDHLRWQITMGELLFTLQRSDEALAQWSAISNMPNVKSDDLFRLADILLSHGFTDAAGRTSEKAAKISTSVSDSARLVRVYADTGRFDEALKLLHELQQQANEPELSELNSLQIQILRAANRLTEETRLLAERIKQASTPDPAELRILATLQDADGRLPEATETIEAALLLSPNSVSSLILAARLYQSQQRFRECMIINQRLADLSNEHRIGCLREIALMALELSDPDTAMNAAEELCRSDPNEAIHLRFLADLSVRTGKTDQGLQVLRSAVQQHPANQELRSELIHFLAALYRTEDAIQLLRMSLKEPGRDEYRTAVVQQLTHLSLRYGNYETLAQTLEAEVLNSSETLRAASLLCRSLSLAGYPEKAEEILSSLYPLSGTSTDILLERFRLTIESGYPDRAALVLEQAFERTHDPRIRQALTQLFTDTGNMEGLFRIWFRPAADHPVSDDLLAVIDSLIQQQKNADAAQLCQLVIDQCPKNWQVLFRRALLQRDAKDEHAASDLFRRVYAISPEPHSGNMERAFEHVQEFQQEQRAIAAACGLPVNSDRDPALPPSSDNSASEETLIDTLHRCGSLTAARAMSLKMLLQSALRTETPESLFAWHHSLVSAPDPETLQRLWMMQTLTENDSLLSELWLSTPELSETISQYSEVRRDPAAQLLYLKFMCARWSFQQRFPSHATESAQSLNFRTIAHTRIGNVLQQLFDDAPDWLSGDLHVPELWRFLIENCDQQAIAEIVDHSKYPHSIPRTEIALSLAAAGSLEQELRALILKRLQLGSFPQTSEMNSSVSESIVVVALPHLIRTHAIRHGWSQVTEILDDLEDHLPPSHARFTGNDVTSSASTLDNFELLPQCPSLCRPIVNTFEQAGQLSILRHWASTKNDKPTEKKHPLRTAVACLVEHTDGNERLATSLLLEHLRDAPPDRPVLQVLRNQLSMLQEAGAVEIIENLLNQSNIGSLPAGKTPGGSGPTGTFKPSPISAQTLPIVVSPSTMASDTMNHSPSVAAEQAFDTELRTADLPISRALIPFSRHSTAAENSSLQQLADTPQLRTLVRLSKFSLKQASDPARTLKRLCDYYELLGDSAALSDAQHHMTELESRNPKILMQRAADMERTGKSDVACEIYLKLLKSFPSTFAAELETNLQSFEYAQMTRQLADAMSVTDLRNFQTNINTLVLLATGLTENETERQTGRALLMHVSRSVPRLTGEQLQSIFQSKLFTPEEFLNLLLRNLTPNAVTVRRNVWYGVEDQKSAELLALVTADEHLRQMAVDHLNHSVAQYDSWHGGRLWSCILQRYNSVADASPESREQSLGQLLDSSPNSLSLAAAVAAYTLMKQTTVSATQSELRRLTTPVQLLPLVLTCSETITWSEQLQTIDQPFTALKLLDSPCAGSHALVSAPSKSTIDLNRSDAGDRIVRSITDEQRLSWIQDMIRDAGSPADPESLDLPVIMMPSTPGTAMHSEDPENLRLQCRILNALPLTAGAISSTSAAYSAMNDVFNEVPKRESVDLRLLILMTAASLNTPENEVRHRLTDRLLQELIRNPTHDQVSQQQNVPQSNPTSVDKHRTAADIRRDLTCAVLAHMLPADASLIPLKSELIRRAVSAAREAGDEIQLITTLQTCRDTAVSAGVTEFSSELQRESDQLYGIRKARKFPEQFNFASQLQHWLCP